MANELDDWTQKAYELIRPQIERQNFRTSGEATTYRRTFALALYKVVLAHAARTWGLRRFTGVFPEVKLPFLHLQAIEDEGKGVYLNVVIEFIGVRLVLAEFMGKEWRFYESSLIWRLWMPLFEALFEQNGLCRVFDEYNIRDISDSYPTRNVDIAVVATATTPAGRKLKFPLVLIEVSRDSLPAGFSHKDQSKAATCAAASLHHVISWLRYSSPGFVKSLRTFPVLIDGLGMELGVIFPDFGDAENIVDERGQLVEYKFIYQTLPPNYHFSLLGPDRTDRDFGPESGLFCSPEEGFSIVAPAATFRGRGPLAPRAPRATLETARGELERLEETQDYPVDPSGGIEQFVSDGYMYIDNEPVNWIGVEAGRILAELVKKQSADMQNIIQHSDFRPQPTTVPIRPS